jgi:hypothetical protein
MIPPRYNVQAVSGDFDGDTAGTVNAGNAVDVLRVARGTLSARVSVDCETNTMTMTAKWQVSSDNSTWIDMAVANNAANVTLATGTGSADATVTKALAAPDAVYGWRYARLAIVNGVATGAATDTYAIGYCFLPYQADMQ